MAFYHRVLLIMANEFSLGGWVNILLNVVRGWQTGLGGGGVGGGVHK